MNFYVFVVSVLLVGGISLFSFHSDRRKVRRRPLSRIVLPQKSLPVALARSGALNTSASGTILPLTGAAGLGVRTCRPLGSEGNAGQRCTSSLTCPLDHFCDLKKGRRKNYCKSICPREKPVRNSTFLPRKGDTWIVSYPKSGSTWMRHIVTNLFRYHRSTRNGTSNVREASEEMQIPQPATFDDVDKFVPFLEDRSFGSPTEKFLAQPEPRIFKSHQPYNCDDKPCRYFLKNQARWQCLCPNCASKFRRIIYIVRDGRAVMSSYFQFRLELGHVRKGVNFDRWLRAKRHYPGQSWGDHVLSWWNRKKYFSEGDFLWVKYEDMVKAPEETVRQLGRFFHLGPLDEETIRLTVKSSNRETMMKLEGEKGAGFFDKRYKKKNPKFKMVHNKSTWQDRFYGPGWQESLKTSGGGEKEDEDDKTATSMGFFNHHNGAVMECMGYYQ